MISAPPTSSTRTEPAYASQTNGRPAAAIRSSVAAGRGTPLCRARPTTSGRRAAHGPDALRARVSAGWRRTGSCAQIGWVPVDAVVLASAEAAGAAERDGHNAYCGRNAFDPKGAAQGENGQSGQARAAALL